MADSPLPCRHVGGKEVASIKRTHPCEPVESHSAGLTRAYTTGRRNQLNSRSYPRCFSMLTQAQIAHYLVRDGLVSAESIVDSDFEVVEASRRNRNCKVVSDRGPSYLLKQLKETSAGDTVANESRVYSLL